MKLPLGVGFVSASEVLLGIVTGFLGLMYAVYGFYGSLHLGWPRFFSSLGIAILLSLIAAGCFYTSAALSKGRTWAWKASWGIGLLAILPGAFFLFVSSQPWPNARGKEGWGFMIGLLVLVPGLLGWIALLLPSTRLFFERSHEGSLGQGSQSLF
jgi:hypothetical protein